MKYIAVLVNVMVLFLMGCGNSPSQDTENGEGQTQLQTQKGAAPAAALQTIAEDAPRLAGNAYDYTVLLPLFPEMIAGAGRQTLNGENFKLGANMVSTANASYSLQDRRFAVVIHDVGDNIDAAIDLTKWSALAIDEETDTEFQRSLLIGNQPAFIHYDKQQRRGSMSLLQHNRFIIDISGRNVEMVDLEKAMQDFQVERFK